MIMKKLFILKYGDELNKLENRLYKVNKQIALYDEFQQLKI